MFVKKTTNVGHVRLPRSHQPKQQQHPSRWLRESDPAACRFPPASQPRTLLVVGQRRREAYSTTRKASKDRRNAHLLEGLYTEILYDQQVEPWIQFTRLRSLYASYRRV